MSCEHLICANCAAPVIEARCPVCQAARAQMHRHSMGISLPWAAVALIALLLAMLALHLAHVPG
jgi:hypothetical protein